MTSSNTPKPASFDAFLAFSRKLGEDPLRVQGAGGNTSIKDGNLMWVKASGTSLSDSENREIFVPVRVDAARSEVSGVGDGTCRAALADPATSLRPSIETTFHALLDWPVVAHTHSVATLAHAIGEAGLAAAREKLEGMPVACIPYRKPGVPLSREIRARTDSSTKVVILANHGLVCCGSDVADAERVMEEVETRLFLPPRPDSDNAAGESVETEPPGIDAAGGGPVERESATDGRDPDCARFRTRESWIALNERATRLATAGSYYPDHVVFLGPALPVDARETSPSRPAHLVPGEGIFVRQDATETQLAMLRCLSDVLARIPGDWDATPIGSDSEAELLDWDAESYRQALSAKSRSR